LVEIETVKTVQQILSPVSGKIIKWNEELPDNLDLINEDPMGKGWICQIKLSNKEELDGLMDEEVYAKYTE